MTRATLNRTASALAFLGIGRGVAATVASPADQAAATPAIAAAAKPAKVDDDAGTDKPDEGAATTSAPVTAKVDPTDDDDDDDKKNDDDDEGDDDSDRDEMSGKKGKKVKSARARERSRIAAILGHPAASANVELAAHLALTTSLDRTTAAAVLAATPAGAPRLAERMAAAAVIRPGTDGAAPSAAASRAAAWDAAAAAAGVGAHKKGSAGSSWDVAAVSAGIRR